MISYRLANFIIDEIDTDKIQEIVDKFYPEPEIGECTYINVSVAKALTKLGVKNVKIVGGNFLLDTEYYDIEEEEYTDEVSHTWIEVSKEIYDFSLKMFEGRIDDIKFVDDDKYNGSHYPKGDMFEDEGLIEAIIKELKTK